MAGTVTVTHTRLGVIKALRLDITGDASDGSVPDTELPRISGRLLALETNPGGTAPTADYDITVDDAHGHDVLEGAGEDRSASATEKVAVVFVETPAVAQHPPVAIDDVLTFKLANNSVNSAGIEAVLYYIEG